MSALSRELNAVLFPKDGAKTYAVIDGASCSELLTNLDAFRPEHVCLYAGELAPDLQEAAPYLIHLAPHGRFTDWLLSSCLGQHWGLFARTPADLRMLRKHFRSLLLVKNPHGQTLYFRFYDPRVFSLYLRRRTRPSGKLFSDLSRPISARRRTRSWRLTRSREKL